MLVPASTKLSKLHDVLQTTIGWMDCHLPCYDISGVEYRTLDPDDDDLLQFVREDCISLKVPLAGRKSLV